MSRAKIRRTKPVVEVVHGDCITGLKRKPDGFADLVIADPPYNLGQPYDAYEDSRPYDDYMAWTRQWMAAAVRALQRRGTLWVFAPDEWVDEIGYFGKHKFGLHKRRHLVWAFTFGQAARKNFTRSHCHLLYFTKTKTRFTFNEDGLRVPSARQLIYADKRADLKGKLPDDTWMLLKGQLEPYMTPDRDTWLVSRICGTFKEREKHSPNQIPLPVMERIVLSTSDPEGRVVDLFAGTGSAGVACAIHNRSYLGYDVSRTCVKHTLRRIAESGE